MTEPRNAQGASVLGALVADAAALGLHWLYDQDRVAELAGDAPEFCDTTAADFDGYPAYFAHAAKQPGDFSQYGEQVMVMLQSLAACGTRPKTRSTTSPVQTGRRSPPPTPCPSTAPTTTGER